MNLSRRTPRSVERGITWLPRHDSYYVVAGLLVSSREVDPLCVTQAALLAVEGSLARAGAVGGYGLLTGQLCTCPRTRQHYVLIDGVRECSLLADANDVYGRIALELGARVVEVERSGRIAVGCYLGGAAVVPQPSAGDIGLLRTLFPLPWQAMLLRDEHGAGHGGVGAFIRVEPMNMRAYAAPFVELLPFGRRRAGDPPRSAVSWSNYHPTEPVAEQALTAAGANGSAARAEPIGRRMQQRILSAMDGLVPRRRPDGGQGRNGAPREAVADTAVSPAASVPPSIPSTVPPPQPVPEPAPEVASASTEAPVPRPRAPSVVSVGLAVPLTTFTIRVAPAAPREPAAPRKPERAANDAPAAVSEPDLAPPSNRIAAGVPPHHRAVADVPVETTPVETTPVETTPVETAPVETAPVEAAPVEAAPVRAEPVHDDAVHDEPVQDDRVHDELVRGKPARAAQASVEPVPDAPRAVTGAEDERSDFVPILLPPEEVAASTPLRRVVTLAALALLSIVLAAVGWII